VNLRALPVGHWVIVCYGGSEAVARFDDPVVPAWRRVRDGKPRAGDVAAVAAWLARRPRTEQLALWEAERSKPGLPAA
jgi:hypothetical protein